VRRAGLRFFANLARNAGFSEPRTKILDGNLIKTPDDILFQAGDTAMDRW
jgi:hypothetical protein